MVFPTGGMEIPPTPAKNLLNLPHIEKLSPHLTPPIKFLSPPHQKSIPPTKQQFSSYNPIKAAFLVLVIALCVNFILFGHLGHVSFDFN